MFDIALYQPEIPPNTGNVIRLCANLGCSLHLIEPLGFDLDDKRLRRAGLDYHEWASVQRHANYEALLTAAQQRRIIGFSTKAKHSIFQMAYSMDDILLFGPETRGLPDTLLQQLQPNRLCRIPMAADSRSLNLSNAVAVVAYEACRQLQPPGLV